MPAKVCLACKVEAKMPGHPRWCVECWLTRQPVATQQAHRAARLAAAPADLHRSRVPEREWPPGRRWCAGCQSFPRLSDCSGSRCSACASAARHGAAVEKTFGITAAEYDELLAIQEGRCAICRSRPRAKRMAVDHDHKLTGRESVRGLLCGPCNHDLLGAAHDDVDILRRAVAYLTNPPARRLHAS